MSDEKRPSELSEEFRQSRREALRRWRQANREKALNRSIESRMESVVIMLGKQHRTAYEASLRAQDERAAAALRGKAHAYLEAQTAIVHMLTHGYLPKKWRARERRFSGASRGSGVSS